MAKRHHRSHRSSRREGAYGHSDVAFKHNPDRFNDEHHREQEGVMDGHLMRLSRAEMYAGMEPRRRQELEDAGMIHEDHRMVANLPQEVIMKPYPRTGPYLPEGLDDTIEGVDRQMDYDDEQRRRHFYPKKV